MFPVSINARSAVEGKEWRRIVVSVFSGVGDENSRAFPIATTKRTRRRKREKES